MFRLVHGQCWQRRQIVEPNQSQMTTQKRCKGDPSPTNLQCRQSVQGHAGSKNGQSQNNFETRDYARATPPVRNCTSSELSMDALATETIKLSTALQQWSMHGPPLSYKIAVFCTYEQPFHEPPRCIVFYCVCFFSSMHGARRITKSASCGHAPPLATIHSPNCSHP